MYNNGMNWATTERERCGSTRGAITLNMQDQPPASAVRARIECWRAKIKVCAIIVAVALMGFGCFLGPAEPDQHVFTNEYDFAAAVLNGFFIFPDSLPPKGVTYATPKLLYESVREPFTQYFTPDEARVFWGYLTTRSGGIGIRLDSVSSGYLIKEVFPNTPGSRAGLLARDTLITARDTSVVGVPWVRLRSLLKGSIGENLRLVVKRDTARLSIEVTLGEYDAPSVHVDSLNPATVVITLTGFFRNTNTNGGSAQEFRNALARTTWADYTILDLRNNGGGELGQCASLTGELVPPGSALIQFHERLADLERNQSMIRDTVWRTSGGSAVSRNLLILVDSLTASASEILVSCVKNARPVVKVIGTHTYGKARAQILETGPDSGLCKVTYAVLRPPSGPSYDLTGIAPDIVIGPGEDALDLAMGQIGNGAAKRRSGRGSELGLIDKREWMPMGYSSFIRPAR